MKNLYFPIFFFTLFSISLNAQWTTHTNGIYYNVSGKNVGVGTSPSTSYKMYVNGGSLRVRNTTVGGFSNNTGYYDGVSGISNLHLNSESATGNVYLLLGNVKSVQAQRNKVLFWGNTSSEKPYLEIRESGSGGEIIFGKDNYSGHRGKLLGFSNSFFFQDACAGCSNPSASLFVQGVNGLVQVNNLSGLKGNGEVFGKSLRLTNNAASATAGTLRYYSGKFEGYNGSAWVNLGASSSGGGGSFGNWTFTSSGTDDLVLSKNSTSGSNTNLVIAGNSANYLSQQIFKTSGSYPMAIVGSGNSTKSFGIRYWTGSSSSQRFQLLEIKNAEPKNLYLLDEAASSDKVVVRGELCITASGTCDYVFEDDYQLRTLEELDTFIKENKHLPGVKNDAQVKEAGMINQLELSNSLLEKVEELTLYTIQQNDQIKHLETQLAQLQEGLAQLKNTTSSKQKD